jgi:undecaprenyl-diphosphatase
MLRTIKNRYIYWKEFSPHWVVMLWKTGFSLLALVFFLELTASVGPTSWFQTWDEQILLSVEQLRSPLLNIMMVDVTALGGLALTIVFGLLAAVLFLMTRDRAGAIHLVLTAGGGFYISMLTKGLVERPRPNIIPQLIHASGFSYPSGHSITTSAVYLTMAILACRHFEGTSKRITLIGLAVVMITLVSFSRVYLGVHYPSDTLSGALIGSSWALLVAALFSKTHFSKTDSGKRRP